MKLLLDSVDESTPGFHYGARRSRVVTARTAVKAGACRRLPFSFLHESGRVHDHTPVYSTVGE